MKSCTLRWVGLVIVVTAASALDAHAQVRMNYLDASELDQALLWAAASPHAQVFTIGHSIDYETNPARPVIYPIRAVRITASTVDRANDPGKNAILFECGSHPREWLATESCWSLISHLVNHAEDARSSVPELLAHADVWVVALTTVAGRVLDDPQGGNPEVFHRSVEAAGWRGNADTRGGCTAGVNVARNFSTSWTGGTYDCTDDREGTSTDDPADGRNNDPLKDYPGFAPFSTLEATALRDLVQNHLISMAVVIHTNSTKIWNRWDANADVGGRGIRQLAALAWEIGLDDDGLALTQSSVGGGLGQFSAWLAEQSDTAGEPDNGTLRAIQTIFVELPFTSAAYNGSIYQADTGAGCPAGGECGSNGFHPSGNAAVRAVIRNSFLLMAEQLIYEARSPGCSSMLPCPTQDFGLVGAKIGGTATGRGRLQANAAGCFNGLVNGLCTGTLVPARDYLPAGSHYVDVRVQNFSAQRGNDDVVVRVTVEGTDAQGNAIAAVTTSQTFRDLALREARSAHFAIAVPLVGADYTVTIRALPAAGSADTFAKNDKKVFKFRTR